MEEKNEEKEKNEKETKQAEAGLNIIVTSPKDAVETIGDDVFTFHTIAKGETLQDLASKYDTSIESMRNWNDLIATKFQVNEEYVVKMEKKKMKQRTTTTTTTKAAMKAAMTDATNTKRTESRRRRLLSLSHDAGLKTAKGAIDVDEVYGKNHFVFHTVVEKETLAEILKKYSVTPCELRVWNDVKKEITRDEKILVVGDEIIVQIKSEKGQRLTVPACTNLRRKKVSERE